MTRDEEQERWADDQLEYPPDGEEGETDEERDNREFVTTEVRELRGRGV